MQTSRALYLTCHGRCIQCGWLYVGTTHTNTPHQKDGVMPQVEHVQREANGSTCLERAPRRQDAVGVWFQRLDVALGVHLPTRAFTCRTARSITEASTRQMQPLKLEIVVHLGKTTLRFARLDVGQLRGDHIGYVSWIKIGSLVQLSARVGGVMRPLVRGTRSNVLSRCPYYSEGCC
eukprot:scaffold41006_cov39-Tisochrysis_lutea.AAC.4